MSGVNHYSSCLGENVRGVTHAYSTKLYRKFVTVWIVTSAQHVYPVKSNAILTANMEKMSGNLWLKGNSEL